MFSAYYQVFSGAEKELITGEVLLSYHVQHDKALRRS
jgi:hypothetical protein